jgi:hypothetical protein
VQKGPGVGSFFFLLFSFFHFLISLIFFHLVKKFKPYIQEDPNNLQPWKSHDNYGYRLEPLNKTKDWPEFEPPFANDLINKMKGKKIAVIGRRRIGKSFTIEYICTHFLRTSNTPFFVMTFVGDGSSLLSVLQTALSEFDPVIAPPENLIEAIKLFFWLAYSGVYVFLDEFQRIRNIKGAEDIFQVN